jgi:hypothetical protein
MQSAGNALTRRKLAQLAVASTTALAAKAQGNKPAPPDSSGLTHRFASFMVQGRYADLPKDVLELGKKSILGGLGMALVGSVAQSGQITARIWNRWASPMGRRQ